MFSWLKNLTRSQNKSVRVDRTIVDAFIRNPEYPFLVSFPRTGSHWLRMLLELYYQRPTLVRAFYYPNSTNYLLLHSHDLDLSLTRQNVIYLYRNPVPTIYSQMLFEAENIRDETRIIYWSNLYGEHLHKWLVSEKFTTIKTVITYETMAKDMRLVFQAITSHLGGELDLPKLTEIMAIVTKEEVKRQTQSHDERVVKLSEDYSKSGAAFKTDYSDLVWQSVLKDRQELKAFFDLTP